MENTNFYATGKRKTSIAKTWLTPGKGEITVNNKPVTEYFGSDSAKLILKSPLVLTDNIESFDIKVSVLGGGIIGQAGAIRHYITKIR